jgi:ribosomal silencing factor RsfS
LNILDVKAPSVKMEDVFKAGRVLVVDFSDASDHVRNIVIADLLHKAFKHKIAHRVSEAVHRHRGSPRLHQQGEKG